MAARASGVTLGYGGRTALADLTFTLPAGRISALVGPNGAGKSTLLHALAGLLPPQRGTLEVPARAGPGAAAYVLQATTVNERLPLSVRQVVAMGRYGRAGLVRRLDRADHDAIDAALQALALDDVARRPLHELSGGQRQRTFVAQGLAQQAQLLLLDEPITGLDLTSRQRIQEVIEAERDAGRTVVVSTHDLTDAARADHLLLLAGRIVADGPPATVLTDDHLAQAYGSRLVHLGGTTLLLDGH